jgi:succinate-semialdehyde dehydrogenase/glutarate-semialdehyde dehydrogenase
MRHAFVRLITTPSRYNHTIMSHIHQQQRTFATRSSALTTKHLKDTTLLREACLIGGDWIDATSTQNAIEVFNPSTGEYIGQIPNLTEAQVIQSIERSHAAQLKWAELTGHARGALIRKWHDLVAAHTDDLAHLMSLEQGRPLVEAKGEIAYANSFLDQYASEASRQYGDVIPSPSSSTRILVGYQPVGVVGAITPWNFPAAMITRKVGAALAAGCTAVLKPSELTPFTAMALADLALRAGIPVGVLQLVTGDAAMIGNIMTSHRLVRKITFTGSTRVGKLLISQSADTVKRLSMELGGNAPFIVFKDADLQKAVEGAVMNKFRNCGQTCVTANRFFVHTSLYESFVEQLVEHVRTIKVGDGLVPGVTVGPLINEAAVKKCEDLVKQAVDSGARVQIGGKRLTHADSSAIPEKNAGRFYAPTVVSDCEYSIDAFSHEVFGPVAFVYRFDDTEAVLDAANDTTAGLAAYIYTENSRLINRSFERLHFGMIAANQPGVSAASAPFGGMKESGFGREGAHVGLKDYLEMKTFHIAV